MSVVFPFILPTTGNLTLAQHISSPEYHQIVLNADSSRGLVRDTLKRAKRADSPDYLEVVKSIEDYLPYLFTILSDDIHFTVQNTPLIQWRLPKTSNSRSMVGEAPKLELKSLEFERRMVLLTYSLALMLLAESVVNTTADKDRKWKLATAHLLKSQSILWYLSADSNSQSLPRELHNQAAFISGLQTLISGSLHLLIVYKDLERELEESNNGLSSDSSATSRSLLSRVAIFAADKFSSASQFINSSTLESSSTNTRVKSAMTHFSSSKNSSSPISLGLSDTLSDWLSDARKLCVAATYKYTAIDQAEKGQTGQAIGFLTASIELLGGSSTNKLKKVTTTSSSKFKPGTIQYSQDTLKKTILPILHSYTTENNNYTFQKVPKFSELESMRPSGRQVIAATAPWNPPQSLISDNTANSTQQQPPPRNYY